MRRSTVALMFALLFALPTAEAQASPPAPGAGTFATTGIISLTITSADGNTIVNGISAGIITGAIVGNWVVDGRSVIHPTGRHSFQAVATCICTAAGQSGTVVCRLMGAGAFPSFQGHLVIVSATGDLAGLHGQGTIAGQFLVGGTYSAQIHFDPAA